MITFDDVRNAAERIRPIARRTPVMTSRSVDDRAGASVFLKCENLQRGGAFKIRGASNFILSIPNGDLPRGVVAFSSGNHAQAVALAALIAGIKATIVMPDDAPKSKVAGTRARGAEIVTYDRFKEDREAIGARIASETGATLVPPYDHEWTMAGQGTAALELLGEVPDLDALLVCVGGGGLLGGVLDHVPVSGNLVAQFTSSFWRARVLWNFHQATSISFGSHNMMGAVLAPLANVTPRWVSRFARSARARATHPATVPSGTPRCNAASLRVLPSRSHSTTTAR